jgi:hypothetical protein
MEMFSIALKPTIKDIPATDLHIMPINMGYVSVT